MDGRALEFVFNIKKKDEGPRIVEYIIYIYDIHKYTSIVGG